MASQIMIRPRTGSFNYSPQEVGTMLADIEAFKSEGVKGFVFGCLLKDGSVDVETVRQSVPPLQSNLKLMKARLAEAARPLQGISSRLPEGFC
jgi:copper homeostasis protein CutC